MGRAQKTKVIDSAEDAGQLVSEAEVARRWNCSRATVGRILKAAGVPILFLSGEQRGLKRFRLSDISRIEKAAQTARIQKGGASSKESI